MRETNEPAKIGDTAELGSRFPTFTTVRQIKMSFALAIADPILACGQYKDCQSCAGHSPQSDCVGEFQ